VRNAALEHRRKRRGESREVSLDLDKDDEGTEHEQPLGQQGDIEGLVACRQLLSLCLERTSKATQNLLVRRYVLEETAADIAEELGDSAVSVRMKLKRLRARAATWPR
jgi:DNA-directed RNA polymerase specialized sigma24 family protein